MSQLTIKALACVFIATLALAGCRSSAPDTNGPATAPVPAQALTAGANSAAGAAQPAGDVKNYIDSGDAALKGNDLARAEQEYKRAVAVDSRSAEAQLGLGNVYVRQDKLAEAQSAYQAALASQPDMVSAHANLGVVYYQLGQSDKAVEQYDSVLKNNPDDAETLYLKAAARLQLNNLPDAETLLLKARDLKPGLPEVYYGLGTLYRLKGQKPEAIKNFQKFLEIGPGQDPAAKGYAEQELKTLQGQ